MNTNLDTKNQEYKKPEAVQFLKERGLSFTYAQLDEVLVALGHQKITSETLSIIESEYKKHHQASATQQQKPKVIESVKEVAQSPTPSSGFDINAVNQAIAEYERNIRGVDAQVLEQKRFEGRFLGQMSYIVKRIAMMEAESEAATQGLGNSDYLDSLMKQFVNQPSPSHINTSNQHAQNYYLAGEEKKNLLNGVNLKPNIES